ncbi:unnamed protein product [Lampetra fluviatilis]
MKTGSRHVLTGSSEASDNAASPVQEGLRRWTEKREDQTNPDELTCQICECLFNNPVRLPCGHSFCEVCVEIHWELESTQTEFLCPQKECGRRWESKPTLRKDTTLENPAEEARKKLVSEKLDEIRWAAKEKEATDEGNASSPQSSTPAPQGGSEEWSQVRNKFLEVYLEWKTKRIEVLKMLASMIVELKIRARDGNISKVAGSSTGIVGGALAITGLALIPVTFGASLGLTIAGTVMGVAGGITTAGASIAVLVMNNASTKEAMENIKKDKIYIEKLEKEMTSVDFAVSKLDRVTMKTLMAERVSAKEGKDDEVPAKTIGPMEKLGAAARGIFAAGGTAKGTFTVVDNAIDLAGAAKVAAAGANAADDVGLAVVKGVASGSLRIAGIAVSSVFLAVDVASLILTGIDLHKGSPSKIAVHWQGTYNDLKLHLVGMAKINDYVQRIRK